MYYEFRQMKKEDIPVFVDEMFAILYDNMSEIAPTGNTYERDFQEWSDCVVPVWRNGKRSVILIFCKNKCCGFFQYCVHESTFRMDEIQFRKEYQGSGLFTDLYRYLMTVIPPRTKHVDAFTRKENIKAQGILQHLGLSIVSETSNGHLWYFKGEYDTLLKKYAN
ncbi:MAG: hypothetical protein MJ136_08175 [Clostridia bacterium]|nr:hypothetical protein [Clostridia bacterium]